MAVAGCRPRPAPEGAPGAGGLGNRAVLPEVGAPGLGAVQGRGGHGNFQVVASAAGFNANISLRTAGHKQTIAMRADAQFRAADISLSK